MDESQKRIMIKNYFKPTPKWGIWLVVIGGLLFLAGIQSTAAGAMMGLLVAGAGVLGIVTASKGHATDSQMDGWLQDDLESLKAKSLQKLGIGSDDLVGEQLAVYGLVFVGEMSGVMAVQKIGKDGRPRDGAYRVTVLNLTDKLIGAYQCIWDFTNGASLNEGTDEYFYRDVVSVSTGSKDYLLPNGTRIQNAEMFSLTVSSGDAVRMVLRGPGAVGQTTSSIPTTNAEKAVQTIRTVLREKKA